MGRALQTPGAGDQRPQLGAEFQGKKALQGFICQTQLRYAAVAVYALHCQTPVQQEDLVQLTPQNMDTVGSPICLKGPETVGT